MKTATNHHPTESAIIELITEFVTPSHDEVRAWHVLYELLETEWDRPLAQILRFLTDPMAQPGGLDLRLPSENDTLDSATEKTTPTQAAKVTNLTDYLDLRAQRRTPRESAVSKSPQRISA